MSSLCVKRICKRRPVTVFGKLATIVMHTVKNEMNRALGHLCAHIGLTGPGEPPEDGEMIEMTLSSRHRIQNSSPGGLRPSTLPLVTEAPHNTNFHTWMGKKQFCFFHLAWKAAVLTT